MITSSTPKEYNNESQRNQQDKNKRTEHTVVLPVSNDNDNDDDDIIVEDSAVVLSPSERLNQQIRDDMYKNAMTIEKDIVVALPDNITTASATNTVTGDTGGTHKQRHPFGCDRNWRMILLIIILLVAIALATIFLFFTSQTEQKVTTLLWTCLPQLLLLE